MMKLLYRTAHLIEAQSLRDLLNQHHSFFSEGTVATGVMPEVWVADEAFERALSVKADRCEQNRAIQ